MIPMMQREFVEKHQFTTEEQIADVFAVAQSLPGVMAVNASMLLGYQMAGVPGSLIAGFGCVLPSFLVICIVSLFYNAFIENPYVIGALRGVRGAVIALLLSAIWKLRRTSMIDWFSWVLFFGSLLLALLLPWLNVIFLLLFSAALGLAFYFRRLKREMEEHHDT